MLIVLCPFNNEETTFMSQRHTYKRFCYTAMPTSTNPSLNADYNIDYGRKSICSDNGAISSLGMLTHEQCARGLRLFFLIPFPNATITRTAALPIMCFYIDDDVLNIGWKISRWHNVISRLSSLSLLHARYSARATL